MSFVIALAENAPDYFVRKFIIWFSWTSRGIINYHIRDLPHLPQNTPPESIGPPQSVHRSIERSSRGCLRLGSFSYLLAIRKDPSMSNIMGMKRAKSARGPPSGVIIAVRMYVPAHTYFLLFVRILLSMIPNFTSNTMKTGRVNATPVMSIVKKTGLYKSFMLT